jgi:hypothetical protein
MYPLRVAARYLALYDCHMWWLECKDRKVWTKAIHKVVTYTPSLRTGNV